LVNNKGILFKGGRTKVKQPKNYAIENVEVIEAESFVQIIQARFSD
jgi:hypothetical protein